MGGPTVEPCLARVLGSATFLHGDGALACQLFRFLRSVHGVGSLWVGNGKCCDRIWVVTK